MVGLLALVLLQISLAAHQFDHAPSDVAETCALCVQLDRSGDAPTATVGSLDITPDTPPAYVVSTHTTDVAPTPAKPIRGPPTA